MTDAGTSAVVAGMGAVLLEALGVDAYVIAVATIGAVMLQAYGTHTVGKLRALLQVCTAGLVGAMVAQAAFDVFALQGRALLMALAAFLGFACFQLFDELAKRGRNILGSLADRWGKDKTGGEQ